MLGIDVRATRLTRMWPDSVSCTPASSRPMPAVFGIEPTAIRQWLPSTVRPSESVATTPFSVRTTDSARDFESTVMPLRLKTFSITRGGVGVLAGQHLVAAGDERDLRAERACRPRRTRRR